MQNQGVGRAMTLLKPPGNDLSFPLPPQVFCDLHQHHSSPFLFSSYMDTSRIGLRVCSTLAQMVKCLSAVQETWVLSLVLGRSPGEGNGNPLENGQWKIPWTEEPVRLPSMGSQSQTRLRDFTFTFLLCTASFELIVSLMTLFSRGPGG